MAVDFENPHKDLEYLTLLESIRDLASLIATFIDSREDSPDNIPTRAKRWDNDNSKLQEWTGAAWLDKVLSIAGGGTGASTASGARTALGIISSGEVDDKITTHNAVTSAHQAVSTATASRIMVRDANGRAQVAAPSAAGDIAIYSTVTTHAALTNPHSATALPTADRLMLRDGSGRAQVSTPSAAADIATKGYTDAADAVVLAAAAAGIIAGIAGAVGIHVNNANGNPNISDTALNLNSSLTVSTWTTIGPTGGGCTVTWTALDSVPAAAEWIDVRGLLYWAATGMSAHTLYSERVYGTKYGSTEAVGDDNAIAIAFGYSDSSGYGAAAQVYTARLPVSSRRIRLYRYAAYTGGVHDSYMFLTGWGYNP